ncbi:MAG TPA: ISNCY family transposase, partial [Candidatus Limnocylindria bacterium]|nr:ISNCY family transposase [Candidatus Limnocylindria bacterium]
AGLPAKRTRRRPRHRSRRQRMAAEGRLLQLDGSRHRWLEERGPWLTLLAAVDDATGKVVAAVFREQEDAAGYLELLREIITRHGLPAAVYRDRHGIFETPAERIDDGRDTGLPSQVGRALVELGISSIAARSPQAKGRVERLFGTFQDRLVAELRLAGISERATANAFLAAYLTRHNERFAVAAAEPAGDWLPVPRHLNLERVLVLKYRRKVGKDHTIRLDGRVLQLPRARYAYSAGRSRSICASTAAWSPSTAGASWPSRRRLPSHASCGRWARSTASDPHSSRRPRRCPGRRHPIIPGNDGPYQPDLANHD